MVEALFFSDKAPCPLLSVHLTRRGTVSMRTAHALIAFAARERAG